MRALTRRELILLQILRKRRRIHRRHRVRIKRPIVRADRKRNEGRSGGNLEIVTDGKNGLLVPAGDSSALADAVCCVLTDDDLAQRLHAGAGVRSRDFSWETLVRRTAALLQK